MATQTTRREAPTIRTLSYEGLLIDFTDEAWFNATKVAEKFGKEPHEWLRLPETVKYLAALQKKSGKIPELHTRDSGYVRTMRGRSGGTWLHPRLGVAFARWLDVDFAVWCDEQIDQILRERIFAEDIRTSEYLPTYHDLHGRIGLLAAGSRNARFVHMNMNRLLNQAVGIGAGERGRLDLPHRSLMVVAQSVAASAMRGAADHHDGYRAAKDALRALGRIPLKDADTHRACQSVKNK